MESITIFPQGKKQKSQLTTLLKEMNINFQVNDNEETLMTEEEYYSKIDNSIKQAKKGKTKILTLEKQKELLSL